MKADSDTDERDLQDALLAWQGGTDTLPEGRAEALFHRIREDESFRRALSRLIGTLATVRIAQAPEPRWMALNEALGLTTPATDADDADQVNRDDLLDEELLKAVRGPQVRFQRRRTRLPFIYAAGTLTTIALVSALWFSDFQKGARTEMTRKSPPLAVLLQAEGVSGNGTLNEKATIGQNLTAGPLTLGQGKVSLMFTNGVMLHIEGPAKLDLLTADRVLCHEGRVRLRVPAGAEGFCIETPGGAVTDLGTELGVTVAKDGNTQVAVFEGEAEASLRIPGQEGVRTELLTAAQSVNLMPSTGEIVSTDPDPASFLAASELRVPALKLKTGYEETIKASRPVQYWRMNRLVAGEIPNEVPGSTTLKLAGGARLEPGEPESPHDHAVVHFGGRQNPGALFAAEEWLAPGAAHAVEMWFASTTTEQMDLIAFTTGKAPKDHLELVELAVRQPGRSARPGIVRYLTRWPAGAGGGINIYSEPQFLPYQWHHLVAQQANGKMELYVDGKLVGRADADPFAPQIPCRIQLGCLRFKEGASPESIARPFDGKLAEVAIYDRLLTEEEVRARVGGRR